MNIRNQMNGTGHRAQANGHGPAHVVDRTRPRPLFHSNCIWVEGELVPFEEATVHLLSPTLHYGVVEAIRCYATERGPGVFRLEAHLKRFLQAVKVLGVLDFRWSIADLRRAVAATVQANSFQSCCIRLLLTFGDGIGLDLDGYEPRLAVAAWEWEARPADSGGQAARLMISSFAPAHVNSGLIAGISGQHLSAIQARAEARRAGCDEAVLLDAEGCVAACTGGTLFAVRDGVVYTPPRSSVPQRITRDTAITLAGDLGYPVVEERLSRDELYLADELFVSSTAAEILPVREIGFRPVGDGQARPVSAAVQGLYFETVRGRGARSAGWVEYVMMEPLF